MRIALLLAVTLLGGVVGLFAGGYAFNFVLPPKDISPRATPGGPGQDSRFRDLRVAHVGVSDALDRHAGLHNWIVGGALAGAGVGFFGTLISSRLRRGGGPDPEISR